MPTKLKKMVLPKLTERQKELLTYIRDRWVKLAMAAVCSGVVAGMTAAMAYLVKPTVDNFAQKDAWNLLVIPVYVIIVFLVKGLAEYGAFYFLNYVGQDVIMALRNRLYNQMQSLPLAFFQREKTGDLMSRITNDVNIVSSMFTSAVTGSIQHFFTIVGLISVISKACN